MSMTNFRAVDMPGNNQSTPAEPVKAAEKKAPVARKPRTPKAAATQPEAPVVEEAPVAEATEEPAGETTVEAPASGD